MTTEIFQLTELLIAWWVLIFWSVALGVYRTLVDRVRSGLIATPSSGNQISRLFNDCLKLPNHERHYHVEAAALSSLQVLFGFLIFLELSASAFIFSGNKMWVYAMSFLCAFTVERISSWMLPKKISHAQSIDFYIKIGLFPVVLIRLICKPLSLLMQLLEQVFQTPTQKTITEKEDESEVADHIRVVGREGTNLDPDILEIMGNTIEMSHLKVNDVMIPRNQVQILDVNDSFSTNLEIAKSCGHTRLPLCDKDLDKCLGIIHVKYAFRTLTEISDAFDLRRITKAPARLSTEEPLPVALKRMMKLKVHMALVGDEFGGIDGVITLEDILEEVVGEIQDEFDADEKTFEKIDGTKWRVSGLVPVHELPNQIRLFEQEDDMATVGGIITGELGRIPTSGEVFPILGFNVKILDADDTRVLSMEIEPQQKVNQIISSETK
ncbi:MAG: ion transporter [Opitutae bacterium]|nr:ion transporter [Opitutae bacterium]